MAVLDPKYFSWHEKHQDSSRAFIETQLNYLMEGKIPSNRIINHISPPYEVTEYFKKRGFRTHYDFRNHNFCRVIYADDFGEEYVMLVRYDTGLSSGFYLSLLTPLRIPI